MQFLTSLNLNSNELQNAVIQNLTVAPSTPKLGQIYYNSAEKLLYHYNGSSWVAVGKPVDAATAEKLGTVKIGENINVTEDGTISVAKANKSTFGLVKPGTGLEIASDGTLIATGDVTPTDVKWASIKDHPTTVEGYGITDLKIEGSTITVGKQSLANVVSDELYVHTDNNFTAGLKKKLEAVEDNAEKNIVEIIKVNNKSLAVSPTDRSVNVTVPTKVGQLENDSNYITSAGAPVQSVNNKTGAVTLTATDVNALPLDGHSSMTGNLQMGSYKITGLADAVNDTDAVNKKQMDEAVKALGTVFEFKGSKPTAKDLPDTDNSYGDVWYVEDVSAGYIWIKDSVSLGRWEQLGPSIDLSVYLTKEGLLDTTGQETQNTMSQKAISDELDKKANVDDVNLIPVVKVTKGTISTMSNTVSVEYTGSVINTYVVEDTTNEKVITDTVITGANVTFTVANNPEHQLTCYVVAI